MKKFLAAALALTMTAAMFTACGDEDSSSSAETTTTTTASQADAASTSEEASSADDAASTDDASSAAEDSSEASGGDAASATEFDVTKLPGYDANATETVLTVESPVNTDWANGLGTDDNLNDLYIDGRTFTRDQDLTVKVEFELPPEVYEEFDLGI